MVSWEEAASLLTSDFKAIGLMINWSPYILTVVCLKFLNKGCVKVCVTKKINAKPSVY
jgi:hypothetical protein